MCTFKKKYRYQTLHSNQFKVLHSFYLTKQNHTYISDFFENKMAFFLHFTFFSSCSVQLIIKTDATKTTYVARTGYMQYRLNGMQQVGTLYLLLAAGRLHFPSFKIIQLFYSGTFNSLLTQSLNENLKFNWVISNFPGLLICA